MVQVDTDAAHARGAVVADQLLALQAPLVDCYSSCGLDAGSARDSMARIIAALGLPDTAPQAHVSPAGAAEGAAFHHEHTPSALRVRVSVCKGTSATRRIVPIGHRHLNKRKNNSK